MSEYVALLRGINVGGKNIIKMAALKACFEQQGFRQVLTYIQSGNVLFAASNSERASLTRRIEEVLAATFGYRATVVLRSKRQLATVIERAPAGFGTAAERHRYDVIFLKEPLTAAKALAQVPVREGVDEVFAGSGVLYHSRLISKAAQSYLSKIVSLPLYQSVTIRNWNTTRALLRLMLEREHTG